MALFNKIRESIGPSQPPMISIRDNRFSCRDGTGNSDGPFDQLDVIIADANANISKVYREDRNFNPNDPSPPDCWSDNGVAPSVYALKPQSDRCLTCPHNVRGSRISSVSGASIKECDDRQKLAVFLADDPQRILYQFSVTIGSLANFRQYCRTLSDGGHDLDSVVTRLSFVGTGKVAFKPISACSDEELAFIEETQDTAAAKFVTGEDDRPRTGALPKPDAHEAIGLNAAVEELARTPASPATRETDDKPAPRPAATREALEEALRENRAAGKKPRLVKAQSNRDVADPAPAPARQAAQAAPDDAGVPAFLKRAGMVQNPSLPPDEVTRLIDAQAAPAARQTAPAANPVGDRLAQAFKLPTR